MGKGVEWVVTEGGRRSGRGGGGGGGGEGGLLMDLAEVNAKGLRLLLTVSAWTEVRVWR